VRFIANRSSVSSVQLPHKSIPYVLQWVRKRSGPCAANDVEAGGFVRSRPDVTHPDVQFHFVPGLVKDHGRLFPFYHAFEVMAIVCQ